MATTKNYTAMKKLDVKLTKNSIHEILKLVESSELNLDQKATIKQQILSQLEKLELESEESMELFCDAHELITKIN